MGLSTGFTLTLNIIMFILFYPILLVMYFVLRNESKSKKNIILGVTLSYDLRSDRDVTDICDSYRKSLKHYLIILTIIYPAVFFIKSFSIAYTYHMTWLIIAMFAPYIPFIINNRKLKRVKAEKNVPTDMAGKVVLDTKVSVQPQKRLSAWFFIPPFIMSMIPIIRGIYDGADRLFMTVYIINACLIALLYVLYKVFDYQKMEIIDGNTTLSMSLTRTRRYNWCKAWFVLSWLTGIFNLVFWLFISNTFGIIISAGIYTMVMLVVLMNAELNTRKVQERLTEDSGRDAYVDDDEHWINGIFYYNSNDKHFFINSRVGMNMTMNLARPVAKVLMVITIIICLAMPFSGLWLYLEEVTPTRIEVTSDSVKSYHLALVYDVDIEDIESIELVDTLPITARIYGTSFDTLKKGRFNVSGRAYCELCLNIKVPPFIVIEANDKTYVFGTDDAARTREIYQMIVK